MGNPRVLRCTVDLFPLATSVAVILGDRCSASWARSSPCRRPLRCSWSLSRSSTPPGPALE